MTKNFYKKSSGNKKTLKRTIRPTYKTRAKSSKTTAAKPPSSGLDELVTSVKVAPTKPVLAKRKSVVATPRPRTRLSFKALEPEPVTEEHIEQEVEPVEKVERKLPPPRVAAPVAAIADSSTDSEIDQINTMIKQASQRLLELEAQKSHQEEERRLRTAHQKVDEYNGIDDENEEFELLHQQLVALKRQNKELQAELVELKQEHEKEIKQHERAVKDLQKEVGSGKSFEQNPFFSFSDDLKKAIDAIGALSDPNLNVASQQAVLQADAPPPNLTAVSVPIPTATPTPAPVSTPAVSVPIETTPAPTAPVEPPSAETGKKSKEKKLLVTGVAVLTILLGGGLVSYQLTSKPKVDEALVGEYLQNQNVQVLGIEDRPAAKVPDGVIADKNADIPLEDTYWDQYKDVIMGVQFDYPANTTERVHSSNAITFLRKDSYLFKLTRLNTSLTLEEYWEQNKDKGVKYQAQTTTLNGAEAIHLELQESVEFPGDRYLLKSGDSLFDLWFATDPTVFSQADVARAAKMIESFRMI